MSYIKLVSKRELDITLKASYLDVSPRIISYGLSHIDGDTRKKSIGDDEGWYYIEIELCNRIEEHEYLTSEDKQEYMRLYKILLDNGIYYFDTSKNNIVRDNMGKIKIIDYGHAYYDLSDFNVNCWYIGEEKDLLQHVSSILSYVNF